MAKDELGAWWSNKKSDSSRPSTSPRRSSNDPPSFPTHSSLRNRSSSVAIYHQATTATSEEFDFVPRDRQHLHYRDGTPQSYPQAPCQDQSRYPTNTGPPGLSAGTTEGLGKEEEAMREAIAASERETEERNERSTQEDAELRRALAESSKSAASPSHSRAASQEQAELSQAILESRRQALFESQARRSSSLHPSQPPPPTLDDSEWIIQARNEKGELWREGGAHGWLPPGAGRAGGEDSAEQEMLELAIRISLEEEEARQALEAEFAYVEDPPALPPRPKRYSISPATDSTSDSTDSTPPPPIPTRSLPPVPSSPSLRHTPSLSFVAPSRPKIFEHDENRGSPIEMPFLTPSTSFRTAREPSTSSSEEEDDEDYAGRRFLQGTFGVSSNGGYSDEQGTEESGPSFNSTSSGTSSEEAASFPPFISELAGRSLSLVSERTEPSPSTTSLASLEDEPTTSTSSFPSTNSYGFGSERLNIGPSAALRARLASERERGLADDAPTSLHSSTPSTRSIAPPGPTPNDFPPPANSEEAAILQQSPPPTSSALVDEPEETGETFGDGVRFGYPASCAQEHACAMDGLHSTAPFLEEVELSTAEGEKKGSFSVEARTWVALLRFLMWYGDTTVRASKDDVKAEQSRHCDASLSLEFRQDDEGIPVLRLSISLLPPNHSPLPQELAMSAAPIVGKGKSRASSPTLFDLPDHVVLPTRLSSIAISLYTLRHLAGIALSTQPSKDAAPSYHALRHLAQSISSLATEHQETSLAREHSRREDERLLGKLRDRLRRMKPKPSGNNGAKLLKPPPVAQAQRTQPISRRSRVLSMDADGEAKDLRYLPTLGRV